METTMMRTYTTPEESRELLKLGLDPKTADMRYEMACFSTGPNASEEIEYQEYPKYPYIDGYLPCWSTDYLLKQIPSEFNIKKDNFEWTIVTTWFKCFTDKSLFSVAYQTLINVLKNK